MLILMGRIVQETEDKVLVEAYGTYEDWYDSPDEGNQHWVHKNKIEAINDEYIEPHLFTPFVMTEEALELAMPHAQARRFL